MGASGAVPDHLACFRSLSGAMFTVDLAPRLHEPSGTVCLSCPVSASSRCSRSPARLLLLELGVGRGRGRLRGGARPSRLLPVAQWRHIHHRSLTAAPRAIGYRLVELSSFRVVTPFSFARTAANTRAWSWTWLWAPQGRCQTISLASGRSVAPYPHHHRSLTAASRAFGADSRRSSCKSVQTLTSYMAARASPVVPPVPSPPS